MKEKLESSIIKAVEALEEKNKCIETEVEAGLRRLKGEITFYEDDFFWGSPDSGFEWTEGW